MKKARQGEPFEVHFCCTIQPQRLFQRGNAAARNRDFLLGGIQRQKQRAAGNGLDAAKIMADDTEAADFANLIEAALNPAGRE